ncbi:MAG: outer membrane protein transport protein [Proteobacteria bacterium]|nr:outer membrane protein transport protein [Pseudomonadota bacterium]
MIYKKHRILFLLYFFPYTLHASFIESTMGTAVVNDATASYHNPAALILVEKSQLVILGSKASSHSQFIGQSIEISGFSQSGISKEHTNYTLPSGYAAFPITKKLRLGLAILGDNFYSDIDEPSILRYDQSANQIKNIDYIASLGFKLNDYLSLGGGLTYSAARFISHRIIGFPNLDVPDSQSHNRTKGDNYGWNVGFLIKPMKAMLIGFNYRSRVSYQFRGQSEFDGPPAIVSNSFNFNFWTPARSVMTLGYFLRPTLSLINTIQRVQWSTFKNVSMHGLATRIGRNSIVVPTVIIPYHFRDTWVVTLGGIKKITSKWVLRIAGTYSQSPGNGFYRLTSGDDYVLGASTGYQIYKNIILDVGYAHAFTKNQSIDILTQSKRVLGINKGHRDSISLKLTFNI